MRKTACPVVWEYDLRLESEPFELDGDVLVPGRARNRVAVLGIGEFVERDTTAVERAIGALVIDAVAVG